VASRSLGTLTLDLVAKIGGFTRGMDEAERKADRTARNIARAQAQRAKDLEKLWTGVGVAIGSIGVAASAAFVAIDQLAKSAANFKDLEETTGASAEGLASMAVAAATAGVSMEEIAANSIRLTKGLMGVDGESKAAAAGIKALGLDLADFKKLDPIAQTDALTVAFAGFADGAEKTAVATALWGKSGAEMLKVMKALNEQGGRNVILTQQQIETADAYADSQAKAVAELKQYAQVAAIQALPAITALITEFTKAITAVTGLSKESASLAANNGVRDFAQGAAIAIATVGESLAGLFNLVRAVGGSFESVFADIKFGLQIAGNAQILNNGGFFNAENRAALGKALDERNRIAAEANARYVKLFTDSGTEVSDALRKQFAAMNAGLTGFRNDAFTDPRSLTFGKTPTLPRLTFTPTKTGGGKSAKAEIDEAKKALDELERELALFGQDDSFRKAFKFEGLTENNAELTRYREILKELDRLETAAEIEKTIAALVEERDAVGLTNEQLTIQKLILQGASAEQIAYAQSVIGATQAARDQAAAIEEGKRLTEQYRTPLEALLATYEKLNKALANNSISATTYARAVFDAQAQFDGEMNPMLEQAEKTNDVAKDLGMTFSSAFEDAIVNGGKLSDILKGLEQDILRIVTRKLVTEPLANALTSGLQSIFGGAGGAGGGIFSSFFSSIGSFFGGFFADGGMPPMGKVSIVGEDGPELFVPNQPGSIVPMKNMKPAQQRGGDTYHITVPVQGMVDRRTREQIASTVAMELGRSRSRATA
jgi:hypothetical protein